MDDLGRDSRENPLNIIERNQRTRKEGGEDVFEETVKVNLQSSKMITKNLSCVAIQFDDEGNEIETRYKKMNMQHDCALRPQQKEQLLSAIGEGCGLLSPINSIGPELGRLVTFTYPITIQRKLINPKRN